MLSDEPQWQPCGDAVCDKFEARRKLKCEVRDPVSARQVLATSKDCTDEAIRMLERFAPRDAAVRSDLAAAYYLRARYRNRPSDLVRALIAAESAARVEPPLKAALFNHAILLEETGFLEPAIEAWNAFLRLDNSKWTNEAREHRDKLRRVVMADASHLWAINRLGLPAALRAGDRAAVARLIAPALSGAQAYLEDELLATWANTALPQKLAEARLLAEELSRLAKDPYTADVVAALSSSGNVSALREGHRLLAEGRRQFDEAKEDETRQAFDIAAQALRAGKSPLYLSLQLDHAISLVRHDDAHTALVMLNAADRDARWQRYPHLSARAKAVRGYALTWTKPTEALTAYSVALDRFRALGDEENAAGAYTRRAGVYGLMGHNELALGDAFEAIRRISTIVDPQRRHAVLGEIGSAVGAAGHTTIALRFQAQAVMLLEQALRTTRPQDTHQLAKLRTNVAIARLNRARMYAELKDYAKANEDLQESGRVASLNVETNASSYGRMMTAHAEQTRGLLSLERSPASSVLAFTSAISAAAENEFLTFRARLFAQRAEAKQLAGYSADQIKADLLQALHIIEQEERSVLDQRVLGSHERLWVSYFSRFQDTYQRLIELYIKTGEGQRAFEIAERARTIELKNLLSRFPTLESNPQRRSARHDELSRIQQDLQRNEFLLEYVVYDERTYCWIVSSTGVDLVPLRVGRSRVEGWVATIQKEARRRVEDADDAAFLGALTAAYDELLAEPMRRIFLLGARLPRVAIVPDGPMHGLPFPALRHPETGRFLIEDAVVEIAGSSALYRYSRSRNRELTGSETTSVLLVGDPAFDRKNPLVGDLPRLPGALEEVNGIAVNYRNGAKMLIGEEATIDAFLTEARAKTIIHFAGHAIVNPDFPSRSVLLMANSAKDGGMLYAVDLLTRINLDRTRLVVLAACSSAAGLPIGPEGVGPLVRPIIAARVSAVVGSLWPVDDATAKHVFVSFHTSYGKGEDAAAALRTAQVRLIRSGDRKSVYAWAPYQVIGHSSSPFGGTQK
jgi:CHAT domain-containing protein